MISGISLEEFRDFSILFVEDEKDFVYIIKTFLSDIFGSVDVAYDGSEGLEKALENNYDVIVTDITMPKLNCFEMSEQIKNSKPEQKIIILSAHKENEWLNRAKKLNIDEYLYKPVGVDELLGALHRALQKR